MNLLAEFVPPQPPPGVGMNSFWQPIMTFVQIVPVVAVLWLGLRRWLPQDRALFAVCLLGGAATSLFEPVTDVLAGVWFAPGGMWVMFTTFNRPMPW
ncbi:MAG: hypothetical protein QOF38_685, partial [Pseudonocardiales bacterium]|nr:hypothetical protein [Pseudonocardiales bacterium]